MIREAISCLTNAVNVNLSFENFQQKVDYSSDIEKIIDNLHTTLGASLGLSQSGKGYDIIYA